MSDEHDSQWEDSGDDGSSVDPDTSSNDSEDTGGESEECSVFEAYNPAPDADDADTCRVSSSEDGEPVVEPDDSDPYFDGGQESEED